MDSTQNNTPAPIFEIDQPEEYGKFILNGPREIAHYLNLLQKQRALLTVYLNEGEHFFLCALLSVDEDEAQLALDIPAKADDLARAKQAKKITLSATVDRVKVQFRLAALSSGRQGNDEVLTARLPDAMLRLQRREFFRIETPQSPPLLCRLSRRCDDGSTESFELPLHDLSGGGLSLVGDETLAEQFSLGELFADCRLDIPGENVLSVNLRVRKVSRQESYRGEHQMRLGCEFVNLPGTRMTLIERYITRLEREQNARHLGFRS